MATKDELIAKATELGITLKGEETNVEIGELIKAKVEEKKLADEEEAKRVALAEEDRIKNEADDEAALLKESERVKKEQEEKAEKLKKEREAQQGSPEQERKYTEANVRAMLKQALAELKAGGTDIEDPNNLDDDDPYKQKKVRLPRFQGKFVMAFKNTNTDEYFPELVIHAFDVWNDQIKRNEPWVTAQFEDGSELTVRLETLITKSQKVWCDLVERIEKDTSFSQGKVEVAEVKDYSRSGTGAYRKLKVTQAEYSYKIRLPISNKEVIVGREVINW